MLILYVHMFLSYILYIFYILILYIFIFYIFIFHIFFIYSIFFIYLILFYILKYFQIFFTSLYFLYFKSRGLGLEWNFMLVLRNIFGNLWKCDILFLDVNSPLCFLGSLKGFETPKLGEFICLWPSFEASLFKRPPCS